MLSMRSSRPLKPPSKPLPMPTDNEQLPDSDELFDHAACGLLLTLPNGTIKRVNLTFCRWLGMEREALLGRRIQDLLTMGGKIFHQTHWAPLLQIQGSIAEVKLDLVHQKGHSIPMMLNALRRELDYGAFHELAMFVAEDRNKYERELLSARKIAEQSLLNQSADRAQRLIADLLDFTQARVGQGVAVVSQAIDLHAEVAACVEELRLAFPDRSLVHHQTGEGACMADSDRLFQVIGNLVANAMAYGATDGDVVVTSAFEPHWITVSVHNHGEPVPLDLMDRLFEPMARGLIEQNDDTRSVGLGLFIVREIARAHLGDVRVISNESGGTTFIVSLPHPQPRTTQADSAV